ncbi:hypothetical protein [Haloarcula laminariae]|uniref:hypothetical protein n=1 Tax=Haloarcula laminariae TaxID=2961577 RepID=UPI0021C73C8C|nr:MULTISPECIES: hypothetical protein [Halomicroarcula]
MSSQLTVKAVEEHGDHYHVRFRDGDELDDLETPDWAAELAESEVPGSSVRMGQDDTDEWLIQSVRVPVTLVDGEDDASRKALQVVTVVSEHEAPDSG